MKIEEFIEQIKKDLKIWFEKLNLVVGAVALGFASIAYKTNHSELLGWFFIAIIFAFYSSIKHYFPEDLKRLKNKKNKSEIELVVLKGVESHFLNIRKSFKEAPLLWIGIASLFAVANGFKNFFESKIIPLIGG